MAKKKSKIFPRDKILQLFKEKRYIKVVSKIKQFRIEGMDEVEVDALYIDALKLLSDERFRVGDIQRAIKDIESALNRGKNSELEFLKLKYLCYLDNFSDAKIYANELLQKYKNDKKIIFYSLLIELYLTNTIDKTQLKKVTKAKQEYIFALSAIFSDDIPLALKHLNNSRPRSKAEKNNIEALKAIVLQTTDGVVDGIKPLYKFLLSGDDTNLQNSKNVRASHDEIVKKFRLNSHQESLKKLIILDGYVDNDIVKKQNDPKLALNNITIMLEKGQDLDYMQVYKIFISYEKEFIKMPESIFVLIEIMNRFNTMSVSTKIVAFFKKYLEINAQKFPPFALNYILYKAFKYNILIENSVHVLESLFDKYGDKNIFYATLTFSVNYDTTVMYDEYKQYVDGVFKKYTQLYAIILKDMIQFIDTFEYAAIFLDKKELKSAGKKIESFLSIIKRIDDVDDKYKNLFLVMLNSFSKAVSLFEEDEFQSGYRDMKLVLKKYIDKFHYDTSKLCDEAEEFLESDETIFDSYNPNIVDAKYIKFKMALKAGLDPFVELENYPEMYEYFYMSDNKTAVFELIMEYARYEDLNDAVIRKIFRLTNFAYKHEFVRTTIQTVIINFAQEYLEVSQKIFQYILKNTDAQSVWYLNWLYSYMDMVDKNGLEKDKFFIESLNKFLDIQNRKKFKSIQKRYNLVLSRFITDDVKSKLSDKQQQIFEF